MTVPFVPRKQKAFLKCCFWPGAPFPLCQAILQMEQSWLLWHGVSKLGLLNQKGNYKNGKLNKLALLSCNFLPKVQLPFLSLLSIKSRGNIKSLMPFIEGTWNCSLLFLAILETLAICVFSWHLKKKVFHSDVHTEIRDCCSKRRWCLMLYATSLWGS